jgi:hypothetical protein
MKHVGLGFFNVLVFLGGSILIELELLYFKTDGNFSAYTIQEMQQYLMDMRWVLLIYHIGFFVVLRDSYHRYFYQKSMERRNEKLLEENKSKKE